MSVEVSIGGDTRRLSEIRPDWVTAEVNQRRQDGLPVCVRVRINEPGLELSLATIGCGGGGGGASSFTRDQQAVIDLWLKHKLSEPDFSGGNLVAFLKQLEHFLR